VKRVWSLIRLVLCLVCGLAPPWCAADDAVAAATPASYSAASERQVLVMLHLPPPHFRPDAGYSGAYNDNSGHSARRRIAQDLARINGLVLLSDWPMPVLGVDCYVMEAPAGMPPQRAVDQLSRDPRVEWAQLIGTYHALADGVAPGLRDPLYATQPAGRFWHIAELHQLTTGRDVRVAVIDSGVEDRHPDLLGQVAIKENFVDGLPYAAESHGTAVAGIIAAKAGNGIGIEGVAPGVRLMALRACWEEAANAATRCNSFTLGKALNFALANHAQVINMSLSGPPDMLLRRLIDVALERGVTVVGAVDPLAADGGFPAAYPGVIAADDVASRVTGLDSVMAPGEDIPSTAPGGRWGLVNGTSFSAAHVSGMAALLTELRPGQRLRRDAFLKMGGQTGSAMASTLDACATIFRMAGDCACACAGTDASAGKVLALKANRLQ
jgi:subtilisin family serine protease